jgi:hypothetical protein
MSSTPLVSTSTIGNARNRVPLTSWSVTKPMDQA